MRSACRGCRWRRPTCTPRPSRAAASLACRKVTRLKRTLRTAAARTGMDRRTTRWSAAGSAGSMCSAADWRSMTPTGESWAGLASAATHHAPTTTSRNAPGTCWNSTTCRAVSQAIRSAGTTSSSTWRPRPTASSGLDRCPPSAPRDSATPAVTVTTPRATPPAAASRAPFRRTDRTKAQGTRPRGSTSGCALGFVPCALCLSLGEPGVETAAAPRLVGALRPQQHAILARHQPLRVIGGVAAHHADSQRLRDVLRDRQQLRHWLEWLAEVVLVEPGNDDAFALLRQRVADRGKFGIEELAFVDPDHFCLGRHTIKQLARSPYRA